MVEDHGCYPGKTGDNHGLRNRVFGEFRTVPNNITVIPTYTSWFLLSASAAKCVRGLKDREVVYLAR